jgi:hypothetical protein
MKLTTSPFGPVGDTGEDANAAPWFGSTPLRKHGSCLLCGGNMAKRAAQTITKPSRKVSKASYRAIKKQAEERAAAEKAATKQRRSDTPSRTLTGREARSQERLGELVAWYMLQGADEATARRRAQDEIDDDPRKD